MSPLPSGLHVYYSNQVERLAAQLALDLAMYRGEEGSWKAASIVVPNPNVKDYLRASFAEAFGAVANLEFRYLEGFWNRYANRRLLDRATIFGSILSVLQNPETRQDPSLQPLLHYLEGAPEDLKAIQLSQRLAQHYERMLLQRPDWIRSWDRGQVARGAEPASMELWQRTLWRRLRRAWKDLEDPPVSLVDWLDDPTFAAAPFPDVVFLFGMSHMAPAFHHALAKVGAHSSVRLYLVNPCEEPWDRDPLQRPALAADQDEPPEGDDPFSLHQDRSEVILQRWARPAREQLRLLGGLATGDFLGQFVVSETPSLLRDLQQRILSPEDAAGMLPDGENPSLSVVPCPSPRREAETVANLIWDLAQKGGGDLHFGDIGVLVPSSEQDAYEEHLDAAFRSAHRIPWARAFGASRALRELVEASLLLLDLGGGDLTRADLIRAASHPYLKIRLGATPENWALLCDQAGIVARLDAAETEGTYLQGGRWTWNEGLTRLALGRFMKDDAAVEALGPMGSPVGRSESPSMLALMGPLTSDLRALAHGRFTLPAWQDRLALFLRTYLEPSPEDATEPETAAFQKVRQQLQKINKSQLEGLPPVLLDYQAVRSLVKGTLETLLSDNTLPPGRGVQVSCYTPLRAIPFKVLFLMGLGEGLFPAIEKPDPLDLVASSPRRAGDVSRPEQERQLFLEAVLCARQQLVCTYPSRTASTGDPLQPSPLLLDLEETLGADLWSQVCQPEQPLHRHDLSLFPDLNPDSTPESGRSISCHIPAARHEAEARWLGLELRKEIGLRDLPRHVASMGGSPELHTTLDHLLGSCGPIGDVEPRLPSQMRITLKELRRWLECPVQGGVALRLGVKNLDEDDSADVEDFPVDSSVLDQWWLLRRTFWGQAAEHSTFEDMYGQVRLDKEAQAKVPIGTLSQGERQRHLDTLRSWETMVGPATALTLHRFGTGLPFETKGIPVQDHPPLVLSLDHPQGTTEIHVEGLSEPLRGNDFLMLSTGKSTAGGPAEKARIDSLRAWLSHLALCAAGDSQPRFVRLHCAPRQEDDRIWRLPLPPIAPEEAKIQLTGWCHEILIDGVQKMLPIEALLSGKDIPDLRDWIQDKQDDEDKAALTSFRGPVPRVKDLPVDEMDNGRERLKAFLELQSGWEQA